MKRITDEEFELFKPKKNPFDLNAPFGGTMLETYGKEYKLVEDIPSEFIWTIVDSDLTDIPVITSGYHFVNRIGYIITEVSHKHEMIEVYESN